MVSFLWIIEVETPPPIWCEEVPPWDLAQYAAIALIFAEVETGHARGASAEDAARHLEEAEKHRAAARRFITELKSHLIFNEGIQE